MNPSSPGTQADASDGTVPVRILTVNGTSCDAGPEATVATLVGSWCRSPDGIAVALNSEVVPRSEWETTLLHPGDRVEIVTAAAGG